MASDPRTTMVTYYEAWKSNDIDTFRTVLADDVSFKGPMGEVDGAEECAKSMEGLAKATTDLEIQKMVADGGDVLTWFDLHTSGAPRTPVASWARVKDGQVTRMRVAFDPRGMLEAG
jgi:ketosteroid isomerase-like protein